MPRWQPGTRDRLEKAALDLFAERGYGAVSVRDIADRAGVTRATFFRWFPDKREVLFWGQDLLADLFARGVAEAPPGASIRELLTSALHAVATAFPTDRHPLAASRDATVAQNPELRERLAYKRAVLRDALEGALRDRGIPPAESRLAADIGRGVFSSAYRRWAEAPHPPSFSDLADEELIVFLAAASRVGGSA